MKQLVLFLCLFFFLTSAFASTEKNTTHYLKISLSQCKLWHYKKNLDGSLDLIREYSVATVKKGNPIFPIGVGRVTKIEFDPWWYPTERSIKEFSKRKIFLKNAIPPGDPLNYMGKFKISLSHTTEKGAIYRIHGTLESEDSKIGKRVTGGCIRMHNYEGLELAKILSVGTEVNIIN